MGQIRPFPDTCRLCGLPLRYGSVTLTSSEKDLRFCCTGCRQVYVMLAEANDAGDPETFRETELYRKCAAMGIIPGTEADLKQRHEGQPSRETEGNFGADTGAGEDSETLLNVNLRIAGMWCPACAWVIENSLLKQAGIVAACCDFSTDRLRCTYNPVVTSPQKIVGGIAHLGYTAVRPAEHLGTVEKNREFIRLAVSALLTVNVMMLSLALYSGFFIQLSTDNIAKISIPIFIMASVVLAYGGKDIFRRAWGGLMGAAPGMETLVSIGALCAYAYSTLQLFQGQVHLYFDTASMLVTLVLLGKAIESHAKYRLQEDLAGFFQLQPKKVRICTDDYPGGRYTAIEQLRRGDIFRVEAGEIAPADGSVLEGEATMDESSLTGESRPVRKGPGDRLRAGVRAIQGSVTARADAVAEETTLGRMVAILNRALGQKAPIEGKTDTILKWFAPAIVFLAASTAFFCLATGLSAGASVLRAITVLVISCPCALGLAVPMARLAGISLAGRKGILVRHFSAFEQAENIHTFVFDKTGTVTLGRWKLISIHACAPFDETRALEWAAGLEVGSTHYIGLAIKDRAKRQGITPAHASEISTRPNGISGRIGNETVKIGSKEYLAVELGTRKTAPDIDAMTSGGTRSAVYLGVGGRLAGIFIFGDEIKETAGPAVQKLEKMGFGIYLVSGDSEQTTRLVGREIGITKTFGGRLPEEKAALIQGLQNRGQKTAMVGDGINDAPALATADLGISVHSGYNLNQETADITLMRGDPDQIPEFLALARRVNRKIMQNLVFSMVYNVICIPVAMGGWLNPLVAVSAMLLSSLTVTGNTLLLIRRADKASL